MRYERAEDLDQYGAPLRLDLYAGPYRFHSSQAPRLSYSLVGMKTPGVTVKPLIDMSDGHHFNEVYFDNVRMPRAGLLGELNRGWYMATTTLSFERSGIEDPAAAARYVRLLTQYARETKRHGKPAGEGGCPWSGGASPQSLCQ